MTETIVDRVQRYILDQQEHPASEMGPGYAATCTLRVAGVAVPVT